MKTWIIAALAVAIGSAVVSPGAHGRTWRVNAAGTGDAPSIAAALGSCAAGDSVLVAAGNYQIDSNLLIGAEVTLVSEAGAAATVLERSGARAGPAWAVAGPAGAATRTNPPWSFGSSEG